mgnify:CR=1 FL=1
MQKKNISGFLLLYLSLSLCYIRTSVFPVSGYCFVQELPSHFRQSHHILTFLFSSNMTDINSFESQCCNNETFQCVFEEYQRVLSCEQNICIAAAFVKVTTRIFSGGTPLSIKFLILWVKKLELWKDQKNGVFLSDHYPISATVHILPEPGPARTIAGPFLWLTALI